MKNSFLAGLTSFFLVIFLTLFIMSAQIKALVNPKFLMDSIKKTDIFTQLINSIDRLSTADQESNDLNATALTKVIAETIDPNLLSQEADGAIVAFFNYAEGKTDKLDATIDLTAWKKTFTEQWPNLAPTIFKSEYEKLADCAEGENPYKNQDGQIIINCKSASVSPESVEAAAKSADLGSLMGMVPDQYSLNELVKNNQGLFNQIRTSFTILKYTFWGSLILSLILLVCLVLLGYPNWRAIYSWTGWSMFIASISFMLGQLLSPKITQATENFIKAALEPSLAKMIVPAIGDFGKTIMSATIIIPSVIFGLSVVLIVLSLVLPKYEAKVIPPGFRKE